MWVTVATPSCCSRLWPVRGQSEESELKGRAKGAKPVYFKLKHQLCDAGRPLLDELKLCSRSGLLSLAESSDGYKLAQSYKTLHHPFVHLDVSECFYITSSIFISQKCTWILPLLQLKSSFDTSAPHHSYSSAFIASCYFVACHQKTMNRDSYSQI